MAAPTQPTGASTAEAFAEQIHEMPTGKINIEKMAEEFDRDMAKLRFEEQRFNFQQRRAKLFAVSGLFSIKNQSMEESIAQAMIKIELGESMGFSPAESLQGIHVISGATAVSAALRAARMQSAGFDWDVDWFGTEDKCTGCRLWLKLNGRPMLKPARDEAGTPILRDDKPVMEQVSVSYRETDAAKMMTTLWEDGNKRRASILEKENWKMNPKNMYFARAITNAQRFHAPKVLSINLPSVEEAMDSDNAAADAEEIARMVRPTAQERREVLEKKLAHVDRENESRAQQQQQKQEAPTVEAVREEDKAAPAAEPHPEQPKEQASVPSEAPRAAKPVFGRRS